MEDPQKVKYGDLKIRYCTLCYDYVILKSGRSFRAVWILRGPVVLILLDEISLFIHHRTDACYLTLRRSAHTHISIIKSENVN